jgi:hypothetical protein
MASKPIGSVFLGDLLRNPFSSPPSSPPPHGEQDTTMDSIDQLAADVDDVTLAQTSASDPASEPTSEPVSEPESESQVGSDLESEVSSAAEADVDADVLPPPATATPRERIPLPPPANVDPETSLELRILWLETLLFGPRNTVDTKDGGARKPDPSVRPGHTITRDVEDIQKRLDAIVAGHDGLRQFIAQCECLCVALGVLPDLMNQDEQHADLLTPAFALSGTLPEASPTYDNMSAAEMEALLAEMEPDIRAADRDMREIEELEKKGVTSAGHLGGMTHHPFRPLLFI